MKRITAVSVILSIMIVLAACSGGSAAPDNSNSAAAAGTDAQTEAAGGTAEDTSDISAESGGEEHSGDDEGFVPAEDDQGGSAGADAEDSGKGQGSSKAADTTQESAEAADKDGEYTEDQSGNSLVILEQQDGSYRAAAARKKAKESDASNSALRAVAGDAEGGGTAAGGVSDGSAAPGRPVRNYTVMVYIVGSNLESRYGAATNDMAEMKKAGLDFEKTNLLVYTGGSRRWVSDIPSTSNNVLDMSAENPDRIIARTEVSADMGTPRTLTEFINYCTKYYPAEHYGLVLWDHGGGPLWGYGSDELFKNDSLLLEELRSAMDGTIFGNSGEGKNTDGGAGHDEAADTAGGGSGRKLDWVGFDACLMGTLENAKLWSDYADFLVGSEELEPGRGWDYTFLRGLNETDDAAEIVSGIVDSYGEYYEQNRSQFFDPDVTLAALDLSRTGDVIEAADDLFDAMREGIGSGQYASLNQARSRAKAFGLSAADTREDACDLIDLRDFAGKVGEIFPEESEKLLQAVDEMVVRGSSNVEGAGGVSVYLPGDNADLYDVAQQLYAEDEMLSDPYREFVETYTEYWKGGSNTDWTLAEIRKGAKAGSGDNIDSGEGTAAGDGAAPEAEEMTLQLTQEQAQNASEIYYSVLFRNGYGGYQVSTCNVRIRPDENNVLHIPGDPLLMTAGTDLQESATPWACVQVSDNGEESVYKTIRAILSSGHEFTNFDLSTDEEVSVSVRCRNGERETVIQDITSAAGSAWLSGKGSVDVSGYKSIIDIGGDTLSPVRDDSGRMTPYSEWEYKGYIYVPMAVDSNFRFYLRPASEFNRKFICQVTVRDVNGKLHASEYVELDPPARFATEQVKTDKGTMIFDIGADHAELKKYEGEDTGVAVPETVSGMPVTAVADSAFSRSETLVSVTLPDSVTMIGRNAFYDTHALRQVHLPAGLKSIGMHAFTGSGIREIELPEGLVRIGRAAFDRTGLLRVEIPASVEAIGEMPFARCASLREIAVSGDNPNYKSVDGVLYTGDGKRLIQYPNGQNSDADTASAGTSEEGEGRDSAAAAEPVAVSTVEVADGTEVIGYGAFAASDVRRVAFPETLKRIENDAFFECFFLEELELPDSLEYIGNLSFGRRRDREQEVPEGRARFDSIRIGADVIHIGNDAFTALDAAAFEVDGGNPVYASKGGFITNKAGEMIQTVPAGTDAGVVVPEGITTLQNGVFTTLDENTDFFIPASVFRFSESVFPYGRETSKETGKMENVYRCTIHCPEGSAAQQYASKYGIPWDNNTDTESQQYEEETQKDGEFTYYWRVFKDRAELCGFTDSKKQNGGVLEIPAEYKGLPVTALRYVEEGAETRYNSLLTRLIIPKTVRSIDTDFLNHYWSLTELEADPENDAYACDDGVLFTKDKKTLVFYPGRKAGAEYRIPDGVVTLGYRGFYLNGNIQKIVMPSSLRVIDKQCFTSCRGLREAVFNKGLREINDLAFSYCRLENVKLPDTVEWIGSSAFMLHEGFGELVLPDKLQRAGYNAFGADYDQSFYQEAIRIPSKLKLELQLLGRVLFERYEVDPKSDHYAAEDGILWSKDRKTLVSVPTLREGELHIPEGTLYISYYALNECSLITDIYLPDSLLDIGNIGARDNKTGEYRFRIHCREGSEPQKKLEAQKVPWVAAE